MPPPRRPLHTPRLTLEPVAQGHDRALLEAVRSSLPELVPWMPWAAGIDLAQQRGYRERALEDWRSGREYHFAMTLGGVAVGVVGVNLLQPEEGEIHYWISSQHTGRGLTTEAARGVLEFAFGRLRLKRVVLLAGQRNHGSLRIAEKLGFGRDGVLEGGMEGGRGVFEAYAHHLDRADFGAQAEQPS